MSVGLDIGSKTIKVVELTKEGEKFTLEAAGVIGYTGTEIEHLQEEKDYQALAGLIKKLMSDSKINARDVAISLPESQVFTRTIRFPLLTDAEVASAVKWEAEQYIPFPINEAIIQHQILERKENATPPSVTVLLIAAARAFVEKYIKVASLAGLNVASVETELMALTRALAPVNQTVVITDFGARSTDIAIARNTNLVFSRSVPTAGEAFTRAVSQSLGVSAQQAEEYKKTYGFSSSQLEGKVGSALSPVFAVVAEEIKKAIHFYQTEEKGEAPTSLILSGGGAGLPEIAPHLTKLVGLEVVIANAFAKVGLDPTSAKSLSAFSPLYAIAVGLSLRGE